MYIRRVTSHMFQFLEATATATSTATTTATATATATITTIYNHIQVITSLIKVSQFVSFRLSHIIHSKPKSIW